MTILLWLFHVHIRCRLESNELQENLCDAECYDAELDRCHGIMGPLHLDMAVLWLTTCSVKM